MGRAFAVAAAVAGLLVAGVIWHEQRPRLAHAVETVRAFARGHGDPAGATGGVNAAAGSCRYRYATGHGPLPDPACTPGATNPAVTQSMLASTICRKGSTVIRPTRDITSAEKRANANAYGYKGNPAAAEYDALIPLELGGDPNDPRNLWVEPPSPGSKPADGVNHGKHSTEAWLKNAVCNAVHLKSRRQGNATSYLPLADAQRLLATDWTTAVRRAAALMVKP
jgi:hypothetical protein